MKTLQEIHQERSERIAKMDALVAKADKELRLFTESEEAQYNALKAEVKAFNDQASALEQHYARQQDVAALKRDLNLPANQVPRPSNVQVRDRGADQPWDEHGRGPSYALGSFLQAVQAAAQPGVESNHWDKRLKWKAAATGMGVSTPADGGFLFEPTVVKDLVSKGYSESMLAPLCRKVPIGEMSNGLSVNIVDETSRATGSRFGGVQMYWRGEGDTVTATKPKLRRLDVPMESLMGLMYATREMMRDPVQLGGIFTQAFTEEIAWMLDDAIADGSGVGKPQGFLKSAALISVDKEANQKATTIIHKNLSKMWARLWGRSRRNAVWFINQDIEPELDELALTVGTGGLPPRFVTYGPDGVLRIKGRPVVALEQAKTLGTVGDISLVDLNEYVLIDQDSPEIAESIHVRFLNAENTFRIMYDINGKPYWHAALTPANGSNTQSPYVALATRA